MLGRVARSYFSGLTYARRDGFLSHRFLTEERKVVLDPDIPLTARMHLYLVPGPRYILEYWENEGQFLNEGGFARREGDVALDGAVLLFDSGDFATATAKAFGDLDGILIDFKVDILSEGLARQPVDMILTMSNRGLPECMNDPQVSEPCPVD